MQRKPLKPKPPAMPGKKLHAKQTSFVVEVKPLPEALIKRLKKAAPAFEKKFDKMKNVDHRRLLSNGTAKTLSPLDWGFRVRQLGISRSFPGVKLVIKRAHNYTAKDTIKIVLNKIWAHNKNYKPECYGLVKPEAYAVSETLIAMPKFYAPSIAEVLEPIGKRTIGTERGKRFINRIEKNCGVSKPELGRAAVELGKNYAMLTGGLQNFLVLGFKNGKFVFMPLVDVF